MTISTETSSAGPFYGNGVTTSFPFDFKIVSASHLRVVFIDAAGNVSDLSLNDGDYSVTGVGSEDGGTVVKATPLLTGQTLTIVRNPPLTQETSLANQGPYNADVVENRFDLMVMQIQAVRETTDRSLKVEPGQPLPDMALIAAAEGFAGAAQQSSIDAAGFRQDASDFADAAAASATLANKFANNPEDVEVIPGSGLYAAFHWMRKAMAYASAAAGAVIGTWTAAPIDDTIDDTDVVLYLTGSTAKRANFSTGVIASVFKAARVIANASFAAATFRIHNAATGFYQAFDATALTATRTRKLANKDIDESKLRQITVLTGVDLTTGGATGVNIAIDPTADEIKIDFEGLSTNGTDTILLQLGTAGGLQTTGYDNGAWYGQGAGSAVGSTVGFIMGGFAAARIYSGGLTLRKGRNNTWEYQTVAGRSNAGPEGVSGGGHVALSGPITQLQIARSASATFDGGYITGEYRT